MIVNSVEMIDCFVDSVIGGSDSLSKPTHLSRDHIFGSDPGQYCQTHIGEDGMHSMGALVR
jgi:hypothetical protein